MTNRVTRSRDPGTGNDRRSRGERVSCRRIDLSVLAAGSSRFLRAGSFGRVPSDGFLRMDPSRSNRIARFKSYSPVRTVSHGGAQPLRFRWNRREVGTQSPGVASSSSYHHLYPSSNTTGTALRLLLTYYIQKSCYGRLRFVATHVFYTPLETKGCGGWAGFQLKPRGRGAGRSVRPSSDSPERFTRRGVSIPGSAR